MWKRLFGKIEEWLERASCVRYYAVPVWKPWRDFQPDLWQ
jgi:hypothetical protein